MGAAQTQNHGQGPRFARSCGQGARSDAQGCEAGEEEEGDRPRQEEAAVQPAIRQRGRGCGQEEGTQHAAARQDGLSWLLLLLLRADVTLHGGFSEYGRTSLIEFTRRWRRCASTWHFMCALWAVQLSSACLSP